MSARVASPHQLGMCAVELLQLEWQAFRTQDRAPLGVAERLLDERPWVHSAEHGALEDAVASLLQLRDTVGTTVVCCADVDETLARTIAREAIRKGKTTWRAKPPTNDAERFALLSLAHWMGVRVQFRRS